jgi:hypothetical protein
MLRKDIFHNIDVSDYYITLSNFVSSNFYHRCSNRWFRFRTGIAVCGNLDVQNYILMVSQEQESS